MPYDGSGNFSRVHNWVTDKTNAIKIVASRMDAEFDNYATGLNSVILRNGVAAMTGNLDLGSFALKSIGSGAVGTPSLRFSSSASTGVYSPAAGEVALSAAGVQRLNAHSTGVSITGTLAVSGALTASNLSGTNTGDQNTIVGITGTTAQFNTALTDGDFATLAGVQTLTSKTIALGSNTVSGSLAEFNTALTGADFTTLAGVETLTSKTIALGSNTVSGTTAQFNTALTDGDFVTLAGVETLTNKTLTTPAITTPTFTGTPIEDGFTVTDGAAFEIDPANGSIQNIVLGASRTPKATNFQNNQSITLAVDDGTAFTLTWTDATFGGTGVKWMGGTAPTLATSGLTWITLWKYSGQVYGASPGASA